jgi:predicted aspartyl protease
MKVWLPALAACLLCGFTPLGALGDAIDQPPPAIKAADITLAQVLRLHKEAIGKPDKAFTSYLQDWNVTERGLQGTYHEAGAGEDFISTMTLGPFVTRSGRRHGQSWSQNENGLIIKRQGIHQRSAVTDRAFEYALDHPDSPGAGVRLLGVSEPAGGAYVVEVAPPGGRKQWLFFDARSGLETREEEVVAERRVTIQYDDYRDADGQQTAFHFHSSDGRLQNDADWKMASIKHDLKLATSELDMPQDTRKLVEFPAGVTSARLPARIVRGRILVRITIAGRGLDFLLDSGASGIALDSRVADELHLNSIGKYTQTIAGTIDRSRAVVPLLQIGDLTMRDVVVSTLPFEANATVSSKVVGLLGFDFLDSAVIRIDYEHGTVDALNPDQFAPPANAHALSVALDDGVPFCSAVLGDSRGEHFMIDTGSSFVVVFPEFANQHPAAVTDVGGGRTQRIATPDTRGAGVGGDVEQLPVEVSDFQFGGVDFGRQMIYLTQSARALEGEDKDGLIGSPILQYFNVFLDYSRGRVLLQKNAWLLTRKGAVEGAQF